MDKEQLRRKLYDRLYGSEFKNKLSTLFWTYYVNMSTTAQAGEHYSSVIADTEEQKIFVNKPARVIVGILMVLLGIFTLYIFIRDYNNSIGDYVMLFIVLLVLFVPFLTPKFKKHRIEISTSGLLLDKRSFQWHNILDMYIVARPGHKTSYDYYLVLLLDPEEIFTYELTSFGIFSFRTRLSAYLEHFRSKA
jgi:hypothetical protein